MSERPIRIVLDASAIVRFTLGSIDVGEVLSEINDEGGAAGLPVLCLVRAHRTAADGDLLDLLVNHPATDIVATDGGGWRALAAAYDAVGRLDAASAVLAAIDIGCLVLTGEPELYAVLANGGPVIPLPPA